MPAAGTGVGARLAGAGLREGDVLEPDVVGDGAAEVVEELREADLLPHRRGQHGRRPRRPRRRRRWTSANCAVCACSAPPGPWRRRARPAPSAALADGGDVAAAPTTPMATSRPAPRPTWMRRKRWPLGDLGRQQVDARQPAAAAGPRGRPRRRRAPARRRVMTPPPGRGRRARSTRARRARAAPASGRSCRSAATAIGVASSTGRRVAALSRSARPVEARAAAADSTTRPMRADPGCAR